MSKSFYITTPIYYPNAKPHAGTAYTTVIADVMARYKRLEGYDVSFLTGLDEHGQKIQSAAEQNGFTPQGWVDKMSENFTTLWKKLNISNTIYMRTTEERHYESVKKILKTVYDKGDIYKGEYEGKYCVSDETFVPDNSIVNEKFCPHCGKELITLKENSYFFKLSKYGDKLLEYINNNPGFIKPEHRKNEVVSFIKQGLQDLSITRTSFDWGIPFEFEKGHVVYVWFDALTNYITAAGYGLDDQSLFNNMWNEGEVVHVLGKDIVRFHAIIWPIMLMSAGIKLPDTVAAHGWWTVEGEKMSKSKGNVVDPSDEVDKFGLDPFRYFLMREVTFGQDGDYSQKLMIQRINADLANDLGNLLNRVIGMQTKYFNAKVDLKQTRESIDDSIIALWEETYENIHKQFDAFQISEVLKTIWKFIARMNKYIDETEPWTLYKSEEKMDRLSTVMYNLVESLYKIAIILSPFMPDTSKKMLYQLGIDEDIENMRLSNFLKWGVYPSGTTLRTAEPLFPRIEVEKEIEAEYKEDLKINNPINIEDFSKVNIEVVEIIKATKVEDSDRLLKMIVDTGKEKRQIISGIAKSYNPEDLIGKKVLAVLNLEPVMLKGEVSQGMILTLEEKKKNTIIEVAKEVKPATKVK